MSNPYLSLDILNKVATLANLAEGAEGVRTILLQLFRHQKGINNKLLSQLTAIPVPVLAATRQELIKAEILNDITSFTEKGMEFVQESLGFVLLPPIYEVESFNEFKQEVEDVIADVLGKSLITAYLKALKERPEPLKELDQSRATATTLLRRFLFLLFQGQLEGRHITLLGDDDGLSLLLAISCLPASVKVFDIDDRIINYLTNHYESLQTVARDQKTVLTDKQDKKYNQSDYFSLIQHDLRNPIPLNYIHTQDVIFTDPPYTVPGARLFMQRGRELLRETTGLPLYLAFGPKEPQVHWDIQLSGLNYGFKIVELHKQFNFYQGNLRLGQFSDQYVFQIVYPKSRIIQETHFGELYTREVRERQQKWSKLLAERVGNLNVQKAQPTMTVGYHILAEFAQVPEKHFQETFLRNWLIEACQDAKLTIIDVYTYIFSPYGASILAILQESHLSVHSWPEYNFMSIDIFVCEEKEKAEKVLDYLISHVQPGKVTKQPIIRGEYS